MKFYTKLFQIFLGLSVIMVPIQMQAFASWTGIKTSVADYVKNVQFSSINIKTTGLKVGTAVSATAILGALGYYYWKTYFQNNPTSKKLPIVIGGRIPVTVVATKNLPTILSTMQQPEVDPHIMTRPIKPWDEPEQLTDNESAYASCVSSDDDDKDNALSPHIRRVERSIV